MKSRAERLRALIQDDGGDGSDYVVNQIIAIFKECVPDECNENFVLLGVKQGYNRAREETLKNIEEMGK